MSPRPILRGATGLNNRVDPHRLPADFDAATSALGVAVNVDIDDSLMTSRRRPVKVWQTGSFHSLFRDTGDALIIKDYEGEATLNLVEHGVVLTGIRSGMTKGARASYAQVGNSIFYTNGHEYGEVRFGVSYDWPEPKAIGAPTKRAFSPVPVGDKLAFFANRIWVVVDSVMFASEPNRYGTFDLEKFIQFPTKIMMARPTPGGMWVSDSTTTGFVPALQPGESFSAYRFVKKTNTKAHEWSACHRLVDLSKTHLAIPGLCAVWSSNDGLCIGTQEGQLIIETGKKIIYPRGGTGATVHDGNNVINTIY